MYPELIRVGGITIGSYRFMAALAFAVGATLAYRRALREGLDLRSLFWLAPLVLVSAFAGGRLLFIAVNARMYMGDPAEAVQFWRGGFVGYGGLLGIAVIVLYVKYVAKMPVWPIADAIAPAIPAGIAIYRIGCFMAGCCYGAATSLPWGVRFPVGLPAEGPHLPLIAGTPGVPEAVPRHPTQLYEALFGVVLFAAIWWIANRTRRRDGVILCIVLGAYAQWRFLVETIRDDPRGQLLLQLGPQVRSRLVWVETSLSEYLASHPADHYVWLSTSQIVSGVLVLGSLLFIHRRLSAARRHS
ncbi:MAG: prolipoprotein diacylglyceryl transferase [Acidobacteria bacterium]|nr:prolipoprotein diacylglyceryl transferase [Acidobacteriota bacterium]